MTDLFNNISNDYINPTLPPCAGQSDDYVFKFLPGQQVGIVSGSSIVSAMNLGDILEGVEGWVTQTKILQPGEVTFIQGMTKGISNAKQYFPFVNSVLDNTSHDHSLYMTIDLSISYYNNFRYYTKSLRITADPLNYVSIANATNIAFANNSINVNAVYDTSGLTFTASTPGYMYDITSLDASVWDTYYSFYGVSNLPEDPSSAIPAFKYPNGAMLGYVLKAIYPQNTLPENDFVLVNHVPDYLEWFEPDPCTLTSYIRNYDAVDVGQSGTSNKANTITGGEYLDYITTNNKWEKVGAVKIWLSAPDPVESAVENLITGFYIFNPQITAIKIDYMTIL